MWVLRYLEVAGKEEKAEGGEEETVGKWPQWCGVEDKAVCLTCTAHRTTGQ